jgi:hypothetical protein
MGMSLTQDDLQAIKQLIDDSIDERVPSIVNETVQTMLDKLEDRTFQRITNLERRLIKRIDDFDENLARRTAAGFAEVHGKIDACLA